MTNIVKNLVIAGWTGRDRDKVEGHIRELAALGVTPPTRTPVFYRVSASLLTCGDSIQVLGCHSSGEAEVVLIQDGPKLLVGLGSDHTDRKAEAVGVALSKQMCSKVLAPTTWDFDAVERHWAELVLSSRIIENGNAVPYQNGTLANILRPRELMSRYASDGLRDGTAMFCGTVPAIGGVRWSPRFPMELRDPVLNRSITHTYRIEALPVES